MRRLLAVTAASGLVVAGAVTARADSPAGTVPNCANVVAGAGTYDASTDALHMEVRLNAPPCSGDAVDNGDGTTTTTSASYVLYVIKDKSWTADPNRPDDPNILNFLGDSEGWDTISFETATYSSDPSLVTQILDPGAHVITYDVVIPDDDPVVCVFSLVSGSTVTTQEVEVANEPVDENGNGNTEDDVHNDTDGNNRNGDKFDLGTHTETQEISRTDFFDRAPSEDSGETPLGSKNCLAVDAVTSVINQTVEDVGPGKGYN